MIGEDVGAAVRGLGRCGGAFVAQFVAMIDVVAQDQRAGTAADEIGADDKRLR